MSKYRYQISAVLLVILAVTATSLAWAAPAGTVVQQVRFSQTPEKVRIVFDITAAPVYKAVFDEQANRLVVDIPATLAKTAPREMKLTDQCVGPVKLGEPEPGKVRAAISLKQAAEYKVFVLHGPERLVVDIFKVYDRKTQSEIAPGLKHTIWARSDGKRPMSAHILEVDLSKGLALKPVLSNGVVAGLETLSAMSLRENALAAVNASYFALNGEIIGLLKLGGEIISTSVIPRTAVGIMPGGQPVIDQVEYEGAVILPDERKVAINGVNRARGTDELILFTGYYGAATGSNDYGAEYLVGQDGTVMAVSPGSSQLEAGCYVLSAHGEAARALAELKPGDRIRLQQTLGPQWDKAVHALGAGPMLVKDGNVFLTTKIEEFGNDVAGGRAPRTALGLTRDGRVLLAVIDGRQFSSAGMSLLELALFMQELGAVNAMNLDGGGSSEIVIGDRVFNRPSDGRERRVGTALAVVRD